MNLSYYDYDELLTMPVDSIEKDVKLLENRLKIIKFFLQLRKIPESGIKICFVNQKRGWHFEFCDRNDYKSKDTKKCNCLKFITQESSKFFDFVERVSKDFNISILCKHFKLLDITSSENWNSIDSIQNLLLEECKMDKNFMTLYENLLIPIGGEWKYVNPFSIIPLLEKFKVKRYVFENLLAKWINNPSSTTTDKYKTDEAIRQCPHLMTLYQNCIKNFSGYLKFQDLFTVLHKVDETHEIELEIVNLTSEQRGRRRRYLYRDEFMKCIKKLNGCKNKILDEIDLEESDSLCYIVSFRINGEDSMADIPLYYYQTYDDLVDKKTIIICEEDLLDITEGMVKISFVNDSIGWHFNFCPNSDKSVRNGEEDNICNCLKYVHDDFEQLLDVLSIVSYTFDIGILGKNFEYFNIAIQNHCPPILPLIEIINECDKNIDFRMLYENILLGYPHHSINPTIIPLLEKLNVCQKTFIELLEMWMSDSKDKYWVDENVRKYPRLSGFYNEYYRKWCSGCLYVKDLILVLEKIENNSHIYLTISNATSKELKQQNFEGNKRKVIDEILQNNSKQDIWKIKEFKINDKLYSINEIPSYMFIIFDETDG